jgi:hypothetical protein
VFLKYWLYSTKDTFCVVATFFCVVVMSDSVTYTLLSENSWLSALRVDCNLGAFNCGTPGLATDGAEPPPDVGAGAFKIE